MSGSEGFTDAEKMAHRRFWEAKGRLVALRASAHEVCSALETSDSDLRHRIAEIVGEGNAPAARTVGRFFEDGEFRNKPYLLTALCWAMHQLSEERAEALHDTRQAIVSLGELYRDSKGAFPDFPPPIRVAKTESRSYTTEGLRGILDAIEVPHGEDDPGRPEFPAWSPRFPATPTEELFIDGQRILIKDESYNPTGNHKDRWAWERLLLYKEVIEGVLAKHGNKKGSVSVPQLSMISSGSAAFALQCLLRLRGLPSLRVVMDKERADPGVVERLEAVGAQLYFRDLDEKELGEDDVRQLTDNWPHGIDITTRNVATPEGERFYDWLVCELLQHEPTYIFVPYGTGDLYANIVCFLEKEERSRVRDRRLIKVQPARLRGIHVLGATTNDPKTRMDKLYAAFRPTLQGVKEKIDSLKKRQVIGANSRIAEIPDNRAQEAHDIAKTNNIRTELSGIAGLALFLELRGELDLKPEDTVIVVNTGWMYSAP